MCIINVLEKFSSYLNEKVFLLFFLFLYVGILHVPEYSQKVFPLNSPLVICSDNICAINNMCLNSSIDILPPLGHLNSVIKMASSDSIPKQ